jgi:hypothetical protein
MGRDYYAEGLTLERLGLDSMSQAEILDLIENG